MRKNTYKKEDAKVSTVWIVWQWDGKTKSMYWYEQFLFRGIHYHIYNPNLVCLHESYNKRMKTKRNDDQK